MVKLGDAFVELSAVEAIAPVRNGWGYAVFLTGGRIMNVDDVTEEEVVQVLSEAGYLELVEAAPVAVVPVLTVPERAELRELYLRGFRFAAKDEDGRSFAFVSSPEKGRASWLADDTTFVVRLRNEYDGLSFSDEAPLYLAMLFEEE